MKRWIVFTLALTLIASVPFAYTIGSRFFAKPKETGFVKLELEDKGYQYLTGFASVKEGMGAGDGIRQRIVLQGLKEGGEYAVLVFGSTRHVTVYREGARIFYNNPASGRDEVEKFTADSSECEITIEGEDGAAKLSTVPPILFKWETYRRFRNRALVVAAFFFGMYLCFFFLHGGTCGNPLKLLAYSLTGVAIYAKNFFWVFMERDPFPLSDLQGNALELSLYATVLIASVWMFVTYQEESQDIILYIPIVRGLSVFWLHAGSILLFVFGVVCERMRTLGALSLELDFVLPLSIWAFLYVNDRIVAEKEKDVQAYVIEKALLMDENEQQSIQLMVSQIKPHFIYNVFVCIKTLCQKNLEEAEAAIVAFSDYLRENVNTISTKRPIPLKSEIKHVKNFLYLEKIRFGNRVNVKWDVQEENLLIPALTLQVLVENAIRHGIGKKEEGGTVSISSMREEGYYILRVEDDGVGFDVERELNRKDQDVQYSTLLNVKQRMRMVMGGDILYESELGVGTLATVRIPYAKSGVSDLASPF